MTIKNIFVPTVGPESSGEALETSLFLSRLFGAHVDVLFIKEYLDRVLPTAAEGLAPSVAEEIEVIFRRDRENMEKLSRQKFDGLLDLHRIDLRENSLPMDQPSASWKVANGSARTEIVRRGAAYDLIVVGRPANDAAFDPLVEAALFGTGRPVLVAPPEPPETIGERVMIGWNKGVQSARAVQCAMPFLRVAGQVSIFMVVTGAKEGPSPHDIARLLKWHDIDSQVDGVQPDHRNVGEILLSQADSWGADLLVMGAFSHSKLREMILGGVTKHVLAHAEVPVLMVH